MPIPGVLGKIVRSNVSSIGKAHNRPRSPKFVAHLCRDRQKRAPSDLQPTRKVYTQRLIRLSSYCSSTTRKKQHHGWNITHLCAKDRAYLQTTSQYNALVFAKADERCNLELRVEPFLCIKWIIPVIICKCRGKQNVPQRSRSQRIVDFCVLVA